MRKHAGSGTNQEPFELTSSIYREPQNIKTEREVGDSPRYFTKKETESRNLRRLRLINQGLNLDFTEYLQCVGIILCMGNTL